MSPSSASSFHANALAAGLSRLDPQVAAATARLSSGQRLDRPSADVAATGLVARLDGQQARLHAVEVNVQNGVSRTQSTAGQLNTLANVLTRMSELATLTTNPVGGAGKDLYAQEFTQLQNQLRQTVGGPASEIGGSDDVDTPLGSFNGSALFGPGPGEIVAVGPDAGDRLTLPVINLRSGSVGDAFKQDASGAFTFKLDDPDAVARLDAALDQIAGGLAGVGAAQSRLEFSAGVAITARANHEAALSTLRDTDVATETTNLARLQILTESHTAMLAQARDASRNLLPLLARQ